MAVDSSSRRRISVSSSSDIGPTGSATAHNLPEHVARDVGEVDVGAAVLGLADRGPGLLDDRRDIRERVDAVAVEGVEDEQRTRAGRLVRHGDQVVVRVPHLAGTGALADRGRVTPILEDLLLAAERDHATALHSGRPSWVIAARSV